MIRHLRERLLAPRAPAGYKPGATLGHLLRNLDMLQVRRLEAGTALLANWAQGWQVEVRECVEAHLLMHVVTCEFRLCVPSLQPGDLYLELRHTGAIRRMGITALYRGGDQHCFALIREHLLGDQALMAALMPLDFKRLTLKCREGQWHLTLEHIGGSEVVNRIPAFRRYIKVSPEQRDCLLASLTLLSEALHKA